MRRIAAVALFLSMLGGAELRAQHAAPNAPGVTSVRSPWDVAETVARFERALAERGITRFALIEHDEAARGAGLELRETKLLIFGSPAAGTPVMVHRPLAALDLPLKLLIWRNDDGVVYVSYNAPSYLAERHALAPTFASRLAGLEALVRAVLE